MVTDDGIADLFESAAQDLDPAVDVILGRAEQMGRRLRTRRRVYIAVGSSLVVAAMAGSGLAAAVAQVRPPAAPAGAPLIQASGRPGESPVTGGKGSPSPARTRKSTKPAPSPSASPAGGMTPQEMLGTLRRLLPAGAVLSDVRSDGSTGDLEVDYNDGKGAVDLMISVSPTSSYGSGNPLNCPDPLWPNDGTRPAGALPVSCVMRSLPGGGIERDAVMYADIKGFYGYDIYDQRPDGITVFIQVGNGINYLLPQVDRARPPGSMAEWAAVAENPAWHL